MCRKHAVCIFSSNTLFTHFLVINSKKFLYILVDEQIGEQRIHKNKVDEK